MCDSYRKVNGITEPFNLTIPRCDDAITTVGSVSNKMYITSLDARQGYHQISVCHVDQEKLAFFTPNNQTYMFLIMPFRTINAPGLYSDIMKNFKDEWVMLFIYTFRKIGTLINEQVTVIEIDEVFIEDKNPISGNRAIIDDILIFCSNLGAILVYLEFVCKFFQKYRVGFRLDKYDFLKESIG